jgi:acetoin utilization deacetylase AcuC-like enzyme
MNTAYISHPDTLLHVMDGQHPESPARITTIQNTLQQEKLWQQLMKFNAPVATDKELQRVHSAEYVARIRALAPKAGLVKLDADTAMGPMSLSATLHASGAGILATDLVMHQRVKNAFCCTRPPGHHAGRENSAGFCIFNHVAVATAHAMQVHNIKRVAIIDFDVHHGDGTEDIFKHNSNVMLCSTFQHPFYPYRGSDTRSNNMLNIPLTAKSTGKDIRRIYETEFAPALAQFKPEFIFISAGFDAHQDDPLADLQLSVDDYRWMTDWIKEIAKSYAYGRIVSVLEGGYDLNALSKSATAHLSALMA